MALDRSNFDELVKAAIARDHSLVPLSHASQTPDMDNLSGLGANFIAHLIATRDRVPQTRTLRRGSQGEANESYAHSTAVEDDVVTIRKS